MTSSSNCSVSEEEEQLISIKVSGNCVSQLPSIVNPHRPQMVIGFTPTGSTFLISSFYPVDNGIPELEKLVSWWISVIAV